MDKKVFVWGFFFMVVLAMVVARQLAGAQVILEGEYFSLPGMAVLGGFGLVLWVGLKPARTKIGGAVAATGIQISGKTRGWLLVGAILVVVAFSLNSGVKRLDLAAANGGVYSSSISSAHPVAVQAAVIQIAPQGSHAVVAGDTLWSICRNHYGSATAQRVAEVTRVNTLPNGGATLQIGQVLTLP